MRRSIIAPPGQVIVVRDLSQIEARVLAWLAEQADLLDEFKRSLTDKDIDVYCSMASTIFSRPIEKKKDKAERFIGKTTILGCIAEGMRVLTNEGMLPIERVGLHHKVWDGEEFVTHEGVVARGFQRCLLRGKLWATPDHPVAGANGVFTRFDRASVGHDWMMNPYSVSPILNGQHKNTYDIINCGPRHRFAVEGLIVHNCGYGLGWRTYQERLRVGMLGDKGRVLDGTVAQALGVSVEIFLGNEYKRKFVQESLPLGSDFYVHATHCACCEAIINLFRANKEKIPEFWNVCSEALARIFNKEVWKFGKNGVLSTCPEGILLPNGMKIRYVELQQKREKNRIEYSYLKERKTHFRVKTYGGSVSENVTQALSRCILTDAMLKCKKEGIRIVHTVHDELLAVCREDEGSDVYRRMGEIMDKPPEWCVDLPLASDGGWNRRYQK